MVEQVYSKQSLLAITNHDGKDNRNIIEKSIIRQNVWKGRHGLTCDMWENSHRETLLMCFDASCVRKVV